MIAPFTLHIAEARLVDLTARVRTYDWSLLPDPGEQWGAGVGLRDLQRLVAYWQDQFDWRRVERRLNQLPHFLTEVEGHSLHFIHLRGDGSRSPVLLLHGWPGSFLEFEQLLEPLRADGHDVIVPSLPGFAFSAAQPGRGVVGPRRAAALLRGLMTLLIGSARFAVQGGDWGHGIAAWMAHDFPEALLGIHMNMCEVLPADIEATTPEETRCLEQREALRRWEGGYNLEQETRPQTLAVAMADSPVGFAAWILEKFGQWADLPKTADGTPDLWARFSEEQLLSNLMLYLGTSAVVTASWIYHGKRLEGSDTFPAATRIAVPTGVAAFPDPAFPPAPRSLVAKGYNLVHFTDMPRGGHFAAWEEPELLLADLRAFLQTVDPAR